MPHTIDIGSGEALARVLDYYGLYDPDPDGAIKIVCPFHADMNPSLLATLDNGRWHCFGCDRGGTAVEFVNRFSA